MTNPFLIAGPAVISFSGGRTSAYMLYRILKAHGGTLPDDVVVTFANTGREMPATLDFVRRCGEEWGVKIVWLEYRHNPGRPYYEIVNHNSASRNGEPLAAAFNAKSYLPNPVTRFCTVETKIRTIKRYIVSVFGWKHWAMVIGLRADESRRVIKATAKQRDRWHNLCPLFDAKIEEIDVLKFWRAQPFDLMLKGHWEGNCDGCFLKNRGAISRIALDYPERFQWWIDMEASKHGVGTGGTFRADRENYAEIARVTRDQGVMDFDMDDGIPCDQAGCGV